MATRKLYATIRPESQYYCYQQEFDSLGNPLLFSVTLDIDNDPMWPVRGGLGGRYALFDVDLWVEDGDTFRQLAVHNIP